tara:strand:- start:16118 stop:17257 length:1140 start_codon:yes stop_codon:yes gene_type:complete
VPKKIIAIVETKLTINDINKFGFEFYISKGVPVEIFNIAPITRPNYFTKYTSKKIILESNISYQQFFYKLTEFSNRLEDNKNSNIFLYANNENILNILNKKNIKYYHVQSGSLPVPTLKLSEKIFYSITYPRSAFKKIKNKINNLKKQNKLIPYLSFSSNIIKNKKSVLSIPSYDCDSLINWKKKSDQNIKSKITKEYALYIETPCSHPDGIYAEDRFPPEVPCSHEDYYKPINSFFKIINKDMNLDIKILRHPRSTQDDIDAIKYGTEIHNNKIEYFKNAKIVLSFGSGAISFAANFYKPIVFMTHSKLTFHNRRNIKYLASYFKKKPINLDKFNLKKTETFYNISKKDYDKFKINYFGNADSLSSHEIIYNKLYNQP